MKNIIKFFGILTSIFVGYIVIGAAIDMYKDHKRLKKYYKVQR